MLSNNNDGPSRDSHPTIPALVFGSGITATGVIRSLGRARIPQFSICERHSRPTGSRWYREFPGLSEVPSVDRLEPFLRGLNLERAVLIPCADDWLSAIAALPGDLKERFPASVASAEAIQTCVDKWQFAQLLMREQLPHPQTRLLQNLAEMQELQESCYQSTFLKPIASLEFGRRHKTKAFLIDSKASALAIMNKGLQGGKSDFPILLQQYVSGPPTNHYFVDGFVDAGGIVRTLFARRRLRMFPPLLGNSTLMETVALSEVAGAVHTIRSIVKALEYRGIFSAEFKLDDQDGLFKILEINARPWWYVEFATRSGVDVCKLAYRDALGYSVQSIHSYSVSKRCVYLAKDLKAYRTSKGGGGYLDWYRSWKGAKEAIFSWDDPGPALAYLNDFLRDNLRKKADQ